MKIKAFLVEKLVSSSWLQDISYYGRQNKLFPGEEIITFKVHGNPKTYIVRGLTRRDYVEWIQSGSKGKFYHILKHKFARGWYDTDPFRIIDRSKIKPRRG
jgi:hypothetical protein